MAQSVVDYEAWKRGYMPPSEHVLIDQLAYRGARVVLGSDWGDGGAFWVVTRNLKLTPKIRKAMHELMDLAFDAQIESAPSNELPPAKD